MMGDFVGYIGPLGVSVIVNFVAKEQNVTNLTNYETVSWYKSIMVKMNMFKIASNYIKYIIDICN